MKLKMFFLVFLLLSQSLFSQSSTISYQGKLTDNNGIPVNQNNMTLTFAIYSMSSGGEKLWPSASVATKVVNIEHGLYTVTLGTGIFGDEAFSPSVFANQTTWLEVSVNGLSLPRTQITNVPTSLLSQKLSDEGWATPGPIGAVSQNTAMFSKASIGTSDESLSNSNLKVGGGILYSNGSISNIPGLLFYDANGTGNFKYYDNSGVEQVLGTGTITYDGSLWLSESGDIVGKSDVIVQSSLGVGLDMPSNFSFGFATIAIRENNTRILFDDSSNPPFPNHDWMLVANESSSGGQNYFAIQNVTDNQIPFLVHSTAISNSLVVKDRRVGIGTDSPILNLQIRTYNTPAVRLEQDNSGIYSPQTWDLAGNEANFFVRDVTSGSLLPFRIRPGAPTSSIDISASGNVGFGTSSPKRKIHVMGLMRLQPTTAPTDPEAGDIYFDSDSNKLRCYDGTEWHDLW